MINSTSIIAVVGGGGRTGQFLVRKLIQKSLPVKVLLRKPESFPIQSPLIEVVHDDVLNPAAVYSLLSNCNAVINTVGQRPGEPLVACNASLHIIQAMKQHHLQRYIVVAGINVDTPLDKKGQSTLAATDYMKNNFPIIQEDRQKAYALLSQSKGIDWTLVRVPMIEFVNAKGLIKVSTQDCLGSTITAGDVANFLVDQLDDKTYYRQAPFIANV